MSNPQSRKNRLKAYLADRSRNNADRQTVNRHNLPTMHTLRDEAWCLGELSALVAELPEEPAVSAVTERMEQEAEQQRIANQRAKERQEAARSKRHAGRAI